MDGPRNDHTQLSKSERQRQIPYDITYMWNLKQDLREDTYETETDSDIENKLMVAKGEGRIGSSGLADANQYIQNG